MVLMYIGNIPSLIFLVRCYLSLPIVVLVTMYSFGLRMPYFCEHMHIGHMCMCGALC